MLWRVRVGVVDWLTVGILLGLNVVVRLGLVAYHSFVKLLPAAYCRYFGRNLGSYLEWFSGDHWLVETAGADTVEVAQKDRAARLWCENATVLTGTAWHYLKVAQKEFIQLQPHDFEDLLALG